MPKAKGPAGRFARRRKPGKPGKFNPIAAIFKLFSKTDGPMKNEMSTREASLWLMFFYYWIGCIMYSDVLEGWSTLDALYFLTYTMTTVGYGDLAPSSNASKWFTTLWALVGVGVIAIALMEIAGALLDARDALQAKTKAALMKAAAAGGGGNANTKSKNSNGASDSDGSLGDGGEETREDDGDAGVLDPEVAAKLAAMAEKKAAGPSKNPIVRLFQLFPVLWCVVYVAAYMFAFGALFSWVEGWNLVDGCYFAIVTGTSVGYGDLSPRTPAGRLASLLYVPFAVVFVGQNLSTFADGVLGGSSGGDAKLEKLLSVDLSLEALLAMDEDGDGDISEFEFLRFMLVSAEMGEAGVLDSLHEKFNEMDEDGSGCLTVEDLRREPLGTQKDASVEAAQALQGVWTYELDSVLQGLSPAPPASPRPSLLRRPSLASLRRPSSLRIFSFFNTDSSSFHDGAKTSFEAGSPPGSFDAVTPVGVDLAQPLGIHLGSQTLRVYSSVAGSQAEKKGVKDGWRCVSVGATAVATLDEFRAAVVALKKEAEAVAMVDDIEAVATVIPVVLTFAVPKPSSAPRPPTPPLLEVGDPSLSSITGGGDSGGDSGGGAVGSSDVPPSATTRSPSFPISNDDDDDGDGKTTPPNLPSANASTTIPRKEPMLPPPLSFQYQQRPRANEKDPHQKSVAAAAAAVDKGKDKEGGMKNKTFEAMADGGGDHLTAELSAATNQDKLSTGAAIATQDNNDRFEAGGASAGVGSNGSDEAFHALWIKESQRPAPRRAKGRFEPSGSSEGVGSNGSDVTAGSVIFEEAGTAPAAGAATVATTNFKSAAPPSRRNSNTPARNSSTPARNSSTPARNSSTLARNSSISARNSSTLARNARGTPSTAPPSCNSTPARNAGVETSSSRSLSKRGSRDFIGGNGSDDIGGSGGGGKVSSQTYHFESPGVVASPADEIALPRRMSLGSSLDGDASGDLDAGVSKEF